MPDAPPDWILYVDDEPQLAAMVVEVLTDEGYQVHHSADGYAALEWAKDNRPSLILLDMMLPRMDGPTLGKAIFDMYGPTIPLVVTTALRAEEAAHIAADLSAFATLLKPFELAELCATVQRGLDEARRRAGDAGPAIA